MTALLERKRFALPPVLATGSTSYFDTLAFEADTDEEVAERVEIIEHFRPNSAAVRATYRAVRKVAPVPSATAAISGTAFVEPVKLQALVGRGATVYDASPTPALAFAALDLLRSDDELFKEAVQKLSTMQGVVHRDSICERLLRLLELYREDYDGRALSAESLASFITFLQHKPTIRRPSIAATPTGNLYVVWKDATGQKLVLHFLSGGRCRYSAFVRNANHETRIDEHSGSTTADSVARRIDTLGLNSWIDE